jgi:hypothetical protein
MVQASQVNRIAAAGAHRCDIRAEGWRQALGSAILAPKKHSRANLEMR